MFEITDEFIAQAGFTDISDEQKEALKAQVTLRVQNKIGDRIVEKVGEDKAEELESLMDGNAEHARSVLEKTDKEYQSSDHFKNLEALGKTNNATDDEIVKEYAIFAWMRDNDVDVLSIVQESMNEAMAELQSIYEQAVKAVNDRN